MSKKEVKSQIPILDGIRAIALILVVNFHFGLYLSFVPGFNIVIGSGALGVQVFFILSSLLLSMQFLRTNYFGFDFLIKYVKKRLLRILPLFYFSSFFLVLIGFSANKFDVYSYIRYILFVHDLQINPVVWSLFLEMRFYLILPFLMFLLHKVDSFGIKYRYVLLGFMLCVSYYYRYNVIVTCSSLEEAKNYLYTSFLANSDCFILGILLSYVFKENIVKQMITKWLYVLLVLSFLGVFCTMYEYKHENFMPAVHLAFLNPIHNLLWALIIFCLMLLHDKYLNMLFANKFMVWLSQLSYSIYIWHLPIRAYMLIVAAYLVTVETPLYFLVQFVLSWVVTLLVSVISYRFVEKPFLALK